MISIKCVLLDDELPSLVYLKALVEQISSLEIVKVYNNSEKFLSEYHTLEFDLVISDIQMPGIDGLALANLMSNKPFIFTTAYKEFAVDAFDLNAVDYLTKPIKKERLERAILKLNDKFSVAKPVSNYITINTDKGKMVLKFADLLFIRVSDLDPRDKIAFLKNGNSVVLKNITFKELLDILPGSLFSQINKKEILAYEQVNFFTSDTIVSKIVKNDKFLEFTLSASFATKFKFK
jgi:two-component system, LytTR family, response regulator